jgi:2-iminoacetate synthase
MADSLVPDWLQDASAQALLQGADAQAVKAALGAQRPDAAGFAALISPAAAPYLEAMAQRAQPLTRRHFGRTVSLYAPLYLSNYCSSGCAYCGFASDREQPRCKLNSEQLDAEVAGLAERGLEDVLLLTGEETPQADLDYLVDSVARVSQQFHNVTVETFAMDQPDYGRLVAAGCTGVTLYQETYDPELYAELHRWGQKRDYAYRLGSPERGLAAGMRTMGIGALLGLAEPRMEALRLYLHARHLQRTHWRSGISISFPRICHEVGDFSPQYAVDDALLVQLILAFRLSLPEVPLVLSTRENAAMRDGLAGVAINRMSVDSRTTVGGYSDAMPEDQGQFDINDTRDVASLSAALVSRGLEPVFKNWDAVFRQRT